MGFSSLNLGIINTIFNFIIKILTDFTKLQLNLTYSFFSSIFYLIGSGLGYVTDFLQAVFRGLIGIGDAGHSVVVDATFSEQVTQDPILRLISSDVVINLFISMVVLAIGLIIVSTIVSLIRQEYTAEGAKNSKGEIVGKAIKAFGNLVIVPVVVVIGVLLSNILLRWVDMATSSNSLSIGATVFKAAAYDANKMRSSSRYGNGNLIDMSDSLLGNLDLNYMLYGSMGIGDDYFNGDYAQPKQTWSTSPYSNEGTIGTDNMQCYQIAESIDNAFTSYMTLQGKLKSQYAGANNFTYRNIVMVMDYYNLGKINYIVFIAGEVVAMYAMLNLTFGMILRMYKAVIYFVVAPPLIGISPVKDVTSSWRQAFISNVLAAFAPVVAMNVFFEILPAMNEIQLFKQVPNNNAAGYVENLNSTGQSTTYNNILNVIIILCGLYFVKKLSGTFANWIGADDGIAVGKEVSGEVKKGLGTVAQVGMAAATGGASLAAGAASAIGKGVQSTALAHSANKSDELKNMKDEEVTEMADSIVNGTFDNIADVSTHRNEKENAKTALDTATGRQNKYNELKENLNKAMFEDLENPWDREKVVAEAKENLQGFINSNDDLRGLGIDNDKEINEKLKSDINDKQTKFDAANSKFEKAQKYSNIVNKVGGKDKIVQMANRVDEGKMSFEGDGKVRSRFGREIGRTFATPFIGLGKGVGNAFVNTPMLKGVLNGRDKAAKDAAGTLVGSLGKAVGINTADAKYNYENHKGSWFSRSIGHFAEGAEEAASNAALGRNAATRRAKAFSQNRQMVDNQVKQNGGDAQLKNIIKNAIEAANSNPKDKNTLKFLDKLGIKKAVVDKQVTTDAAMEKIINDNNLTAKFKNLAAAQLTAGKDARNSRVLANLNGVTDKGGEGITEKIVREIREASKREREERRRETDKLMSKFTDKGDLTNKLLEKLVDINTKNLQATKDLKKEIKENAKSNVNNKPKT